MGRHVHPAGADIDVAQFQTGQEGYGVDLILDGAFAHAPDPLVEQRQRGRRTVHVQAEKGGVPPVVGIHEAGAAVPGARQRTQELQPGGGFAPRFQDMGDRVLRPGIITVHRDRAPARLLGGIE